MNAIVEIDELTLAHVQQHPVWEHLRQAPARVLVNGIRGEPEFKLTKGGGPRLGAVGRASGKP